MRKISFGELNGARGKVDAVDLGAVLRILHRNPAWTASNVKYPPFRILFELPVRQRVALNVARLDVMQLLKKSR